MAAPASPRGAGLGGGGSTSWLFCLRTTTPARPQSAGGGGGREGRGVASCPNHPRGARRVAEAVYLANPSPMLSHEPGGWPPARNSSQEGGQARTPPDPPPCIEGGARKRARGRARHWGGVPSSADTGVGTGPWDSTPWEGGTLLVPAAPPWQAGSPGIPRRCRQLAALLLFSRCWLQPLRRCQPLAFPTCPLPPPPPASLAMAKHRRRLQKHRGLPEHVLHRREPHEIPVPGASRRQCCPHTGHGAGGDSSAPAPCSAPRGSKAWGC